MTKILFLVLALLLISSCTSTTRLRTIPIGADVYIDNKYVGKTPYEHTDRKWIFAKTHYRLEKSGYKVKKGHFFRNEERDWGAILGVISLPWSGRYKKERQFELKKMTN